MNGHPGQRPGVAQAAAAVGLVGDGVAGTVALVRGMHTAVAGRVFRATGPAAAPVRLVHDAIGGAVYRGIDRGGRWVAGAVGGSAARVTDPTPLTDTRWGGATVAALNGLFGDRLAGRADPLALPMSVRVAGRDVPAEPAALRAAFPTATGDVVVFLHGLCESDAWWWLQAARHYGDPSSTHGSRLAAEFGCTPVYLRYNTGRHIWQNGETLSELLDRLVTGWPVPVHTLTLVGHSMGGLVVRAACHHGCRTSWAGRLRRAVYLGSPHLGAPLEVAASATVVALRALPETRPFGDALASRSVGIKDLRYGAVLVDDWGGRDPDLWCREPAQACPLLDSASHYYVGVTLASRSDTVAGRVVGDLLVTFASASGNGRRRRLAFAVDAGRHLGRLHHFDLLNHPLVYRELRRWFAG